jgi:hypothetical protein
MTLAKLLFLFAASFHISVTAIIIDSAEGDWAVTPNSVKMLIAPVNVPIPGV